MSTKPFRVFNRRANVASALLFLAIATTLYGCSVAEQQGSSATVTSQTASPSPTTASMQPISSTQTISPSQAAAAHDHYAKSLHAFDKKDYSTAIAELTTAIQLDPSVVEYYVFRAQSYQLKGDGDNALADYTKVVQMESNPATQEQDLLLRQSGLKLAYSQMGEIYFKLNQYNEAISNYSAALSAGPAVPYIYEHRGDCYKAIGEKDKALADYQKELSEYGSSGTPGVQYLSSDDKQRLEQKIKDLGGII